MNKLSSISKDEILEAIKKGIKEAIHEMMDSGDGFDGPIIRDYILEKICEAVRNGVFDAMPYDNLCEAVKDGVWKSFPSEDKILDSIYNGTVDRK